MLQVGTGKFWVTGIISKDKDGVDLVKKGEGRLKYRIKLMVQDSHGKMGDVYDPVFSVSEKTRQIVNACGDSELKELSKSEKINIYDLVGVGGNCVIGVSKEREGYDRHSTIECYLRHVKTEQDGIQKFKKHFEAVQEEGALNDSFLNQSDVPF